MVVYLNSVLWIDSDKFIGDVNIRIAYNNIWLKNSNEKKIYQNNIHFKSNLGIILQS